METNAEIEAEEKAGERRLFEGCEWFIIPILVLSIFAAAWQLHAQLSWEKMNRRDAETQRILFSKPSGASAPQR
jgi:hypothetical protein